MKIAVFGATGSVGSIVVPMLLAAGHTVAALARTPKSLAAIDSKIDAIEGDVTDPHAVKAVIDGSDSALCLLGAPLRDRTRIRTRGTKIIVEAMRQKGVKRLVCLSSFGAGDSWSVMPALYRWIIAPALLRHVLADHNGQEMIIAQSTLDWTLVRPVNLIDGPAQGYHYGLTDQARMQDFKYKVRRADVAQYLAQTLEPDHTSRQAIWIGG